MRFKQKKFLYIIVLFQVEGRFYVNKNLEKLTFDELMQSSRTSGTGFLPAVKQIGNVASLPAIVKV